jgi:hypothetical protein
VVVVKCAEINLHLLQWELERAEMLWCKLGSSSNG